MTIRGGGDPRARVAAKAEVQNGPAASEPRRRCARLHHGPDPARIDRIQACGATSRARWRAPLGSPHPNRGQRENLNQEEEQYPCLPLDSRSPIQALARRTEVDVEPMLRDVDADEHRRSGLVHDPVSLDAGSLISPGDRSGCEDAAGGAPCFRPALADPWESGLPPAYPALLRAAVGSRQHTNG
jgi:hypothetical protein